MYLLSMLLGMFLLMGTLAVDLSQQVSFFVEGLHLYCRDQRYAFFEDELIAYSLAFCGTMATGKHEHESLDGFKGIIHVEKKENDRTFLTISLLDGGEVVRELSLVIFLRSDGALSYAFRA